MAVPELATVVAAAVTDRELVDVDREDRDAVHAELVHVHLPVLADAGLVEWNRTDGTVSTTAHPVLDEGWLHRTFEATDQDWDDVLRCVQDRRRRTVLAVLDERGGRLGRRELARHVAARERVVEPHAVPEDGLEEVLVGLHHTHLPVLEEAGLIATDDGQVRTTDHPALASGWLSAHVDGSDDEHSAVEGSILPDSGVHRPADDERSDIWTIEGRHDIIARGQSLFERADDELFLMVTTEGLIEDGCVRRLRDAIDRGVDVYVGSQTTSVRDFVREELPGAIIWEPQLDWLNLPPNHEKVGRLVFADRDAVMIGTFGERDEGTVTETALTGEGRDNGLVILLRELLGTRLDHLDAQSPDFRSQIPL